jgi:hypothetical protein
MQQSELSQFWGVFDEILVDCRFQSKDKRQNRGEKFETSFLPLLGQIFGGNNYCALQKSVLQCAVHQGQQIDSKCPFQ